MVGCQPQSASIGEICGFVAFCLPAEDTAAATLLWLGRGCGGDLFGLGSLLVGLLALTFFLLFLFLCEFSHPFSEAVMVCCQANLPDKGQDSWKMRTAAPSSPTQKAACGLPYTTNPPAPQSPIPNSPHPIIGRKTSEEPRTSHTGRTSMSFPPYTDCMITVRTGRSAPGTRCEGSR
jgi:hypothetical protein